MSTEHPDAAGNDASQRPRTRAEARALRQAAEAAQAAEAVHEARAAQASEHTPPVPQPSAETAAPEQSKKYWIDPEDSDWQPSDGAGWLPADDSARAPIAPARTEDSAEHAPSQRTFVISLIIGLAITVAGVVIALVLDGPTITGVDFDGQIVDGPQPTLTLTLSREVAEITPEQVELDPDATATVTTEGKTVTLTFDAPLRDDTEYLVSINGVTARDGERESTVVTTIQTPAASLYLLQRRDDGDDAIFRTDLSGEKAVSVFEAENIDDYRATSENLVVVTAQDGVSQVTVVDRYDESRTELVLPGEGYVAGLQVTDDGSHIGYTFTERDLSAEGGLASVLVTQPIDGGAASTVVQIDDVPVSVGEWRFIPHSTNAVLLTFDGELYGADATASKQPWALGQARTLLGVSRANNTAIIDYDGLLMQLNPETGALVPLPVAEPDYGAPVSITSFPGGTLRHVFARSDEGVPTGQGIIRVADDGAAEPLVSVSGTDSIVQSCAAPNGRYTAVTVAPDLPNNPYDRRLLPLPQTLHTHIVDTTNGDERVVLEGFDASWCTTGPRR
ncbi:hypothetical protein [Microbacterium sp. YY-01]|uniref:hypothetical protein n=1 Tax=Microbacterium sp. YY-01 TaxID=3421634 RepID=UPI003D1802C0